MTTDTLVRNLKTLRKKNGLTQEAIATAVGLTRAAYAHYENGIRDIPHTVRVAIAQYYGISPADLASIDYATGTTVIVHSTAHLLDKDRAAVEAMTHEELINHTLALTLTCRQQSATIKKLKSIIDTVKKNMPSNLDEL
jgi:transcriptional regulator with XRE-family HTH domain